MHGIVIFEVVHIYLLTIALLPVTSSSMGNPSVLWTLLDQVTNTPVGATITPTYLCN